MGATRVRVWTGPGEAVLPRQGELMEDTCGEPASTVHSPAQALSKKLKTAQADIRPQRRDIRYQEK